MKISQALRSFLVKSHGMKADATDDEAKTLIQSLVADGKMTAKEVGDLQNQATAPERLKGGPSIDEILNAAAGGVSNDGASTGGHIRVKAPSERYLKEKSVARHRVTGATIHSEGRPVYQASELDFAKIGVWFKHFQRKNSDRLGQWHCRVPTLSEHERELLAEMYEHDRFCGTYAGDEWTNGQTLRDLRLDVKALLNDSTSGGTNLVPFEFDAQVVTYPQLYGELFPYVDVRPAMSDETKTGAFSNPTLSWTVAEGSPISLLNTDSIIAAQSAANYPVTISIEYGKDLEADSPVDVGRILTQICGETFQAEIDKVIAVGNGTTQPEGIFTASGTVTVNTDNTASGPPTLGDYETALFAIGKQYRNSLFNPSFVSNDTTYQRRTGIKIDPQVSSTDQRPVFGMTHNDYSTLGWPHRINNSIGNRSAAFVALKKYVLYRRAGFEPAFVTGDRESLRRNTNLLVMRGRFGGYLRDVNAAAVWADGQS